MTKFIKNSRKITSLVLILALTLIISTFSLDLNVSAASFGISGPSSVEPNGTFTVSFGSGTTGQYSCSVSGGSVVSAPSWVEGGGSVTVKAGSSGKVTVTVTAQNVATADYEDIPAGTSKSVSVSINSPATPAPATPKPTTSTPSTATPKPTTSTPSTATPKPTTSTPKPNTTPKPDDKSSDANLKSLSVSGLDLNPAFSSGTTSYTAEVWDIEEITISAQVNDSKSKVTGTGTRSITAGENNFTLTVTAENGTKKSYNLVITKHESPTVFFDFNGKTLGVVKEQSSGIEKFVGFDTCVLSSGEEIFNGWYNSPLDISIVYLIDEDDNEGFYVLKDDAIISTFQSIKLSDKNYFIYDSEQDAENQSGYIKEEITIGEYTLPCLGYESEYFANYKVINLISEGGEKISYLYSVVDDTLIASPNFIPLSPEEYTALSAKVGEQDTQLAEKDTAITAFNATISDNDSSIKALKLKSNILLATTIILAILLISLIIIFVSKNKKSPSKHSAPNNEIKEVEYEEFPDDIEL